MSVLIKGMKMPKNCGECNFDSPSGYCRAMPHDFSGTTNWECEGKPSWCPLIELPPHGDLIDRDALIKDGWLNLHKEVMRMGGYAVHELPLKNPSIPVIIDAEGKDG